MEFEKAVDLILRLEGGYSIDAQDRGGETKFGVSKRAFPHINIKDLTKEDAIEIYRIYYWDKIRIGEMPPEVRLAVFDCAVNQGHIRAVSFVQKSLGVLNDGIVGPVTLAAFSEQSPKLFLSNFVMRRFEAYAKNDQWSVYGRGWMKRLMEITVRSLALS